MCIERLMNTILEELTNILFRLLKTESERKAQFQGKNDIFTQCTIRDVRFSDF